jgi:hypothetical protein
MAIITSFPGIDASVRVDQKDLQEHRDADEHEESNEVIRYVEAVEGANFSVRVHFRQTFGYAASSDISFGLFVDSVRVRRGILYGETITQQPQGQTVEISGLEVGSGDDWKLRRLQFGSLEIGELHSSVVTLLLLLPNRR